MKLRIGYVPDYVLAAPAGADAVQRRSKLSAYSANCVTRCASEPKILLLARAGSVSFSSGSIVNAGRGAPWKLSVLVRIHQEPAGRFLQRQQVIHEKSDFLSRCMGMRHN